MTMKTTNMGLKGGSLPSDFHANLTITFDFSGCSQEQLIEWATSERKVALARVLKTLPVEDLREMEKNGITVKAVNAGKKVKTRNQQIQDYINMGIPQNIATILVDDPEKAAAMYEKMAQAETENES